MTGRNWTVRVNRGGYWVNHDMVYATKKDATAMYDDMVHGSNGFVMASVVATDSPVTHRWSDDGPTRVG